MNSTELNNIKKRVVKKGRCKNPNKDKKKSSSRKYTSILHKHEEKLEELYNKTKRINEIDSNIKKITIELEKIKKKRAFNKLNNETFEEVDNNFTCRKLEKELENLNKSKNIIITDSDLNEYLLDSMNIISKYTVFDEQEQQLLKKERLDEAEVELLNNIKQEKRELTNIYLSTFDKDYIPQHTDNNLLSNSTCEKCNSVYDIDESYLTCLECGFSIHIANCDGELSYKDLQNFDYRPGFMYDRSSHLLDHLRRFVARDNKPISQEIIDKIILEANKERITDLNTLTEAKIKKYLKRLKLNDYYDNVIGIVNRLTGRPSITLTAEIEEKILNIFQRIQEPYDKYKPHYRKNFLSYSYILHKFFQLLGLPEFAVYFPLLKSIDKLRLQDEIFKKIVDEMALKDTDKSINWVFIPSV